MNENRFTRNHVPSRIIRLVSLNALGGAGLGGACVGLLMLWDFAGLASLISAGREPGAALALLLGGFTATFAALAAATAVMLIPEHDDEQRYYRGRLVPIPVRARAHDTRRP